MGIVHSSSVPNYVQIEKEAGLALLNDPDKAIKLYGKALNYKLKNPDNLHASIGRSYLMIGLIYANTKLDNQLACDHFLKAIPFLEVEDVSSFTLAYFFLAVCYAELGKFPQAYETMRKSLEDRKKSYGDNSSEVAMSLNGMAYISKKEKKYEQALDYYLEAERILRDLPGNKAQHELADLRRDIFYHQHFDPLEANLKTSIAVLHPDLSYVYFFIAEVLLKLGRREQALYYIDKHFETLKNQHENQQSYHLYLKDQIAKTRELYREYPEDKPTIELLLDYWQGKKMAKPDYNTLHRSLSIGV